ncbi:MAG: 4Fe-4S binding protein, partial [Planctomycetota bacterium]
MVFFFSPLVFTLFFGRSFCAAVCPLGVIQDLVLLRPLKVPIWL